MSRQEKTREVIRQLKIVREERGLSLQRIADMTEANGAAVSLATVRRVFEPGSEERNFRYEDSIKPIADVLLEVQNTAAATDVDASEVDALRALVRYKNSYIEELEAGAAKVDLKVQAAKDEAKRKIDHLVSQIDDMRGYMDERKGFIFRLEAEKKQLRRIIFVLSVLLAACLLLIISALAIDVMNPDVGFFWLDDVAAHLFGGDLIGQTAGTGGSLL